MSRDKPPPTKMSVGDEFPGRRGLRPPIPEIRAGNRDPTKVQSNASRGHTLIELAVVMLVVGVLAATGIPRFMRSIEQSRVDMAASNLRAIWTAQRLYWLKHQTYAEHLESLFGDPVDGENFLDPHVN